MPSRSRPSPESSAGSDANGLPNRNRLLSALPPKDFGRLRRGRMTTVTMKQRDSVWQPNQPIEAVYFPLDAVVSVLAVADGGVVEVATIGNEGVVGLPVFLGAQSSPGMAFCQVAGRAERLAANAFLREAHRDGALRRLLQLYSQGFMVQVSQATVCNRLHSAERRLARWLLVVADRVGRKEFPLTHEFMAQMLGVRRATVTDTAGALQRANLIRYRRGAITIRDRRGLERAACECYRIVRDEFDRLLPVGPE
jgi:CRP-like cAMP-binding protein